MIAQFVLLFLFIMGILALLAIYTFKVGLHLQVIQMERKKKPGRVMDILFFDWGNSKERSLRMEALLRYPLLFPVEVGERDKEPMIACKKRISRMNIALYAVLIILLLLVTYAAKAYPNGLF